MDLEQLSGQACYHPEQLKTINIYITVREQVTERMMPGSIVQILCRIH